MFIRIISFVCLLCFALSSVVEAKRQTSPRHISRHVSGTKKTAQKITLQQRQKIVAPKKRSQRISITRKRQPRATTARAKHSRTAVTRQKKPRKVATRNAKKPKIQSPRRKQNHLIPPPPPTYLSQLKPHTQRNAQIGGLDKLYAKNLNGQGITVGVVELSGTWKKLREGLNNPQSNLSSERRENYKNNFLPAIGGPALHPEEQNSWIRLADKGDCHGAFVASVVLDLASQAKILPVSTYNTPGSPVRYDVADAVMDLSQRLDINIINISAGDIKATVDSKWERDANSIYQHSYKTVYTPKLVEAFKTAIRAGKVIVLAAGNEGNNIQPPEFDQKAEEPRSKIMGHLMEALDAETLQSVIFVGAFDPETRLASAYSNTPGPWVEAQDRFLFAPGRHMPFYQDYAEGGTSFASPYICAAIANLSSKPGVTPKQAAKALLEAADQRPERHIYGRGLARADKALEWLEAGGR